jgi:O-antigen/teichoic acid export membrane protein
MKQLAYEFRDFPFFAAPQNVMNALSRGLPVLLLGYFFEVGVAGAYAFGIKIIQAPMGLLLTPLKQVLLQKMSEAYNQGKALFPLFLKTTAGLMAVAFIPCVILVIWAPQIFTWVFGSPWKEAGIYARWLLLWIFVLFINMPSVLIARIIRQQRNLFLYDCFVLLSRTVVLIVGGYYWTPLATVISFSILGFVLNALLILWIGTLVYFTRTRIIEVSK